MIAYALAHLPAAFGSVGLLLQPALAAIIAWFVFGESLSPLQLSGGLVVILGIYFARRGTR
jgi:drug/metabolite transporter (DMT)-like permease